MNATKRTAPLPNLTQEQRQANLQRAEKAEATERHYLAEGLIAEFHGAFGPTQVRESIEGLAQEKHATVFSAPVFARVMVRLHPRMRREDR